MPRMFDILKNKGQKNTLGEEKKGKEKNEEKPAAPLPPVNFPRGIIDAEVKPKKEPEDYALVSKKLISAVKEHGIDNENKTREIYLNAVEIVKILLEKLSDQEGLGPYMDKIYALLDDIFNQLVLGDSILDNIYEKKQEQYYLPYHIVNALVLSSVIGLSMGFNKSRLSHLGLAAIFYDLGIDHFKGIIGQPRGLSEEEHNLIETHIPESLKIVEEVGSINEIVKETIGMHHERINGKGYPRGLKSGQINPYAQIIGLVDTYEAMINNRAYRAGMNAHKAVKFLIGTLKAYFDPDMMKVFINTMSVYPIGSIVRLDTQELAKVISVQSGSPLRPVVMIIQDAAHKSVKERIILDLAKQDYPLIQDLS